MTDEEKIIELLNDYYGDSRKEEIKEEIAEFVVNYFPIIKDKLD